MSYLIMSTAILAFVAYVVIAIGCLVFYVKNIIKLVKALQSEIYTGKTWLRVGGVFIPVLGVIMGFV